MQLEFKIQVNWLDPNGMQTRGCGQIDWLRFTSFWYPSTPSATMWSIDHVVTLSIIALIFVCNLQDCNLEEILDDEDPPGSSKDSKKANMVDTGKDSSLMFKITHKIAYKNVLKGTFGSIF